MGLLVVGISHAGAGPELLERVALADEAAGKLAQDAAAADHVSEAAVVATCNRVEVWAAVDRFHGGVEVLSALLSRHTGVPVAELLPALAVAYDDAAVRHLFSVAAGLESVVVGEPQITGQVRAALRRGQDAETVGTTLNAGFQQALRVGRAVRAATGIGDAGPSTLSVALDLAGDVTPGSRVVVVGAGALAGMAAAAAQRRGAGSLVVANRSLDRASTTAGRHGGVAVALADTASMTTALRWADLVVCGTGAPHAVLSRSLVAAARTGVDPAARPLRIVDLGLPRDVDPAVAELPGIRVVDLAAVAASGLGARRVEEIAAARQLVDAEAAAFLARGTARSVAPAVTALRRRAAEVVEAELDRFDRRLPSLGPVERGEVERTVRRVVDKLLHTPTVRVRELAGGPAGVDYADALRELFSLDPQTVDAITTVPAAPDPGVSEQAP